MKKFIKKNSAQLNKDIVQGIIECKILDKDYDTLLQTLTFRETLLDEVLEAVKKFSCKYLCLLDTDEEAMLHVHFDDDIRRLVHGDCMSYEEANSILSVVEAVLVGVNDRLHDYQERVSE